MTAAQILPLAVVAPLIGAVAAPLACRWSRRLGLGLALASVAVTLAVLAACAPRIYRGDIIVSYLGHWRPTGGGILGVTLTGDAFGLTGALVAASIGALALLATVSGLADAGPRELGGYTCLSLLLIAGAVAGTLTADLLNMFVWFEVVALSSYALTGFFLERPTAVEAAFKIVVLTSIAGFSVFIATALLYQEHGAVNLAQLHDSLSAHPAPATVAAIGLLVAGFSTKAGLVPFGGWLPDAYTAAPGPITALFAGVMVNFDIVALGRMTYLLTPPAHLPVPGLLMVIGSFSAVVGAMFAFTQTNLKRLLAYDTISQLGIVVVGMATASTTGVAGMVYHLISHALFKAMLFLVAGAIIQATGAVDLPDLAGIARRNPALVALFLLGAAAIAGVPPLNGYASVGLIHSALLEQHQYVPYAATLAAQIITVGALARAVRAMFRSSDTAFADDRPIRPGMTTALVILAGACLATGIWPPLILRAIVAPATSVLIHGAAWSHAVLAGGGHLTPVTVTFDYTDPVELTTIAVCLVAGIGLMLATESRLPRWRERLTSVATGSVNDYALYMAAGTAATCLALLLA
ncbi:MAG TPA: proton-conducting transporter membrane subunit [Micromonosporaceae bacterium]